MSEPVISESVAGPISLARPSLRVLAVRGSAFEALGHGGRQLVRLGANLVLTRLLFPEAFGLATLIGVFLYGLNMFTDVGISQAVMRDPRGQEASFLNTAWTLQIMRGAALCVITLVLSFPVAWMYGEEQLRPLLMVVSLQPLIAGFNSTSLIALRRQLRIGWVTGLDLSMQTFGVAIMIVWALLSPTVWALIAGNIATAFALAAISHFAPTAHHDRLCLDPESVRDITHFGRWIMGSSTFFFLANAGDRLLIGQLTDMKTLSVYSIAFMLSDAIAILFFRIYNGVFYPILSALQDRGNEALRGAYYDSRLLLDTVAMLGVGILFIMGPISVELLWDDRYIAAGSMLQFLCVRVAMSCVLAPGEMLLVALGQPKYGFQRSACRAAFLFAGIPLGVFANGIDGALLVIAFSEVPSFFILWPRLNRLGLLSPLRELLAPLVFCATVTVGAMILSGLGWP